MKNNYADLLFGSVKKMKKAIVDLIREKISKSDMSIGEINQICSFGVELPERKGLTLPTVEEVLDDPNRMTSLWFTDIFGTLGIMYEEILPNRKIPEDVLLLSKEDWPEEESPGIPILLSMVELLG